MYYLTRDEQCIDGKLRTADWCESELGTRDFRKDFEQFGWTLIQFSTIDEILEGDKNFYLYGDDLMYVNESERRVEYRATIRRLD